MPDQTSSPASGWQDWARSESSRLDRLEISHGDMANDLAALKVSHANIERGLVSVDDSVRSLAQTVREGARPQWQTYIAGGTLIILIGAAFGSGYVSDQNENTWGLHKLEDRFGEHELKEGHLGTVIRTSELGKKVDQLDITLQREMRLLDSKIQSDIDQLDKMLQREVRLLDDRIEQRAEYNTEEIRRLRSRTTEAVIEE